MAATGWTYEHISRRVTMSQYNRLARYWSNHPPLHVMVAAYLGIKPEEPKPNWETESFESLVARWNAIPGFGMG